MSILAVVFAILLARVIWHLLGCLPQIAVILFILWVIGTLAHGG